MILSNTTIYKIRDVSINFHKWHDMGLKNMSECVVASLLLKRFQDALDSLVEELQATKKPSELLNIDIEMDDVFFTIPYSYLQSYNPFISSSSYYDCLKELKKIDLLREAKHIKCSSKNAATKSYSLNSEMIFEHFGPFSNSDFVQKIDKTVSATRTRPLNSVSATRTRPKISCPPLGHDPKKGSPSRARTRVLRDINFNNINYNDNKYKLNVVNKRNKIKDVKERVDMEGCGKEKTFFEKKLKKPIGFLPDKEITKYFVIIKTGDKIYLTKNQIKLVKDFMKDFSIKLNSSFDDWLLDACAGLSTRGITKRGITNGLKNWARNTMKFTKNYKSGNISKSGKDHYDDSFRDTQSSVTRPKPKKR